MSPTREEVELAERYVAALTKIEAADEIAVDDVELAERHAAALTKIEEAGEIAVGDVELAERYATALQAIEDGPAVSGADVDEAERRAAGGSVEARLEDLLRRRAGELGFGLDSCDHGYLLTRGAARFRDPVSGLTPAEMSEEAQEKACFEVVYEGSDYIVVNAGNFDDCGVDVSADDRFTLELWELADALGVAHEPAVAELMVELLHEEGA